MQVYTRYALEHILRVLGLTPSLPGLQVTLIPGDGIGQEITQSVKDIFEHVNAPIEWEQYDVSGVSSTGETLFRQAMDSLKRNRVGLKGAVSKFLVGRMVRLAPSQASSSPPSHKLDMCPGT